MTAATARVVGVTAPAADRASVRTENPAASKPIVTDPSRSVR